MAAFNPGWSGPFGGVPPFDRADVTGFKPALEAAMAAQVAAIERIVADPAPATFDNTIAALERAIRDFGLATCVYGTFASSMSSPEFQALEREMEPRLAALYDRIIQDAGLFARIQAVYEARDVAGLSGEQKRLAWLKYTEFVRSGARLDADGKKRVGEVNERLAGLYARFSQNVLADEQKYKLVLDDGTEVLNTRSSVEEFLAHSPRRDLREQVWRNFVNRGDNGDGNDNKAVIAEIVRLRLARAQLLGYATHAHWRLERSMARTPERALQLLQAVWKPAVARVREEVADMQALADREGAGVVIEPWDYRYYAEKVRKAKFDIDDAEVRPYLQLEKLRDGMFWVAGELLGLRFVPVTGVPVFHPDVRVWEVKGAQGQHAGLFYFDPFAREGKASGAWMSAYRSQDRLDGDTTPVVSNNCNYVKPRPGEPVLIGWKDASTLFHEFGHALHGLSSSVTYPTLSGTNVDRDYVEFPSQLLEHWLETPEVLDRFARHCRTGEPMPRALVEKLQRASRFNLGFDTVEYLGSALVDMALHLAADPPTDIAAFERETLERIGMPKEVCMRHRLAHFGHLFSSDAYSAGYYSYLWADAITADAFEAFTEAGGPYDKAVARRLCDHVFSRGNTVDPDEGYRAFRGRDPSIDALMRKRGFT
ncbi:MAG TPA: M3 family metallopeptidase [Usitatibacter sp.]|nr:M3 family metallopeptidase [Usitatibacter sp.]